MLDLSQEKVAEYKANIITEDEIDIRSRYGFRKNVLKYPLVYKDKSDRYIDEYPITYVGLVREDEDGKLGSLLVEADGRWTVICSMYLNEMQSKDWGVEELSNDSEEQDSLFG